MKTSIKFFALASLIVLTSPAQAQIPFLSGEMPQLPSKFKQDSLFLNNTGSDNDQRDLFNLYSSAAGYAVWVNAIRNGSGSAYAFHPLSSQGLATQTLRTLSLFDMYLTHGVKTKEREPNFRQTLTLEFVGTSSEKDFVRTQNPLDSKLNQQGLKPAFDLIAPLFNDNIVELPADYQTNEKFIEQVHKGLTSKIRQRYPMNDTASAHLQRLDWMIESYLPLATMGRAKINPRGQPNSFAHFETYFPQFGQLIPKTFPCPQDVTQMPPGTFRRKISETESECYRSAEEWEISPIIQDLKAQGKEIKSKVFPGITAVIEEISLGRKTPASENLPVIKISTDKDFSKPDELDLTLEFGRLDTKLKNKMGQVLLDNPEESMVARGRVEGLKIPLQIRLAFHRVALKLKRPSTAPSWRVAFDRDDEFESITTIKEKSLKSITIYFPADHYAPFLGALFGFEGCNKQVCAITMSDTKDLYFFWRRWISHFLAHLTNKAADASIDAMIPQMISEIDKVADTAIMDLVNRLKNSMSLLREAKKAADLKDKLQ